MVNEVVATDVVVTEVGTAPTDRCPHCSHHPELEPEQGTGYLCRSCGYVQESQIYVFADNWKDSRQEWLGTNFLGAVSSLKNRSGRTMDGSGLGVDTGKTAVRRRQTVQSLLDFITFLCSSPNALHSPRYRIRAHELFRISRIDARKCKSMGQEARYVAAACVMLAVREKKSRVSTREMAVWADLEEEKLGRVLRKTANHLDLNRHLGTDIEEHVDNVLVYLQRLSEDPDKHRLKGETPFCEATKQFLSLVFPRLTELRPYILRVSLFTDRIGVYVNRLGTSHIVAIVFGAMEGMTQHHLHRAGRVFEELTTLLHCSGFGARERYRELVAVVRDLCDCLPLLKKKVEIPGLHGVTKRISAAESFHFSQTLSIVVENIDELLDIRFGGSDPKLQTYIPSLDRPIISLSLRSSLSSYSPSKRARLLPTTPLLRDHALEDSHDDEDDEDGSSGHRQGKRRRIAGSTIADPEAIASHSNVQGDSRKEDGGEDEDEEENDVSPSPRPSQTDAIHSSSISNPISSAPLPNGIDQSKFTGEWPGPWSWPPGEGWATMLLWPDPRVEVAPTVPGLELPKRVKKLRKRTAGCALKDQSKKGLLRSVYERHRPSDLDRVRRRRQPRAVLELLESWQRENRGKPTASETEEAGTGRSDTQQLRTLLLQGTRPVDLPLNILPQSTLVAKAILAGRSIDGYATDELFEEGELEECFRSTEEKAIAQKMWFTQGLDAAHAKREKAELTYLAAMAKSSLGLRKRKTTKFKKPSSKHKEVQALLNQPEDVMVGGWHRVKL